MQLIENRTFDINVLSDLKISIKVYKKLNIKTFKSNSKNIALKIRLFIPVKKGTDKNK